MSRIHGCEARQVSDQMNCHRCGLVWDTDDPDPPQCRRRKSDKVAREELNKIRKELEE